MRYLNPEEGRKSCLPHASGNLKRIRNQRLHYLLYIEVVCMSTCSPLGCFQFHIPSVLNELQPVVTVECEKGRETFHPFAAMLRCHHP
jgi:hypothetical protein